MLAALAKQSVAMGGSDNKLHLRGSRNVFMEEAEFALGLEGQVGIY